MGSFRFRKGFGPKWFRVTFGKTGVSLSTGFGPFRRSKHSSGRTTTTVRTPIPGVSWQDRQKD